MPTLNETHDPTLQSWVHSANEGDTDFPIQNLPFAQFRRQDSEEEFRGGVAIGDQILDLSRVASLSVFSDAAQIAATECAESTLNKFMAMGRETWSALRLAISRGLRLNSADEKKLADCLLPQRDAEYALPCHVGDYTDFFASLNHAEKTGSLFRPDNPLSPNYKWIPIAYHGRASSIVISDHPIHRPSGQMKVKGSSEPGFGISQKLDYEMELGIVMGAGNRLGEPIKIEEAEQHVFGVCLLNDWSARDIQAWESRPLGPFLGKSFITSISPWIVTLEALLPYRKPFQRSDGEPKPLDYLDSPTNQRQGAVDINLEVSLLTPSMQANQQAAEVISNSNFVDCYWTIAQMVTHHSVNGCNLRPGDLLGTGTQSGPQRQEGGCLLELSLAGREPIALSNGETRAFLQDGDTVVMRGWCDNGDGPRIGFGRLVGTCSTALTSQND
ncbi:MAG: fumarylacetoacetase [Pseudomonadota bacterium]